MGRCWLTLPPALQLRNQLPLLRRAHGQPAAYFRTCAQASGTEPLRVQCTDLGTWRRGPFRAHTVNRWHL